MWSHIFLFGSLPKRHPVFEFGREATAASVPGFLCQSGRSRPENRELKMATATGLAEKAWN